MRRTVGFLFAAMAAIGAGCAASYALVSPGVNNIDDLTVVAGPGWNRAPYVPGARDRAKSQAWTRDGEELNSLVFIPGIQDGEPLITPLGINKALPVFRSSMLPNDVVTLAESTFVKIYGEGNAALRTANLRPQQFGNKQGFMFDVEAEVTDRPDYRGIVGAFIADGKLYFMYFLAAEPYYYDKDLDAAVAIIRSASLRAPREP